MPVTKKSGKMMRIVIVGKHEYNTFSTVKFALAVIKRNQKAGYYGYITEAKPLK